MMPQQYYDPWAKVGQAATNAFAQSIMSRPDPYEQALMQAKIQAARAQVPAYEARANAQNALANKYATENKMNENRMNAPGNLANIFGEIYAQVPGMAEGARPTPASVGPQPPVETMLPAPQDVIQKRYQENMPDLMSNAMYYGAEKPGDLGDIFATFAANAGASPAQLKNARMGADHSNMDGGFTLGPGNIRFDESGKQIASAPFKPAGAAGSFSTTLSDGTVIEYGGPTAPTMNNLQKQQVASAKMRGLLDYTRNLAMKDPTNFGFPGFVKGTMQDVTSLVGGISTAMGYSDPTVAISEVQRDVARSGIDPSLLSGVFDPNLPALQTAADLLVFQAASALAGQEGRSVSDRDVKTFKGIIGDPQNIFGNQKKFLSKLNTIENILAINENVTDTAAGGNLTGPASGQTDRAAKLKRLQQLREMKAKMQGGQ